MRIRGYLEGKRHLTLANLRKIFRSHYQEKEVTEMYQLLSSRGQEGGETPKDFLVRLLDLKQKVLFASQEAHSDFKYDLKLVQCMFLHWLPTGLRNDSIKLELKPCLQNTHVTDEGLFEKLIGAVGNEMERQQKLDSLNGLATTTNPVPLVAQVTSTKEKPTGGTQTIHRSHQNPTFVQKGVQIV